MPWPKIEINFDFFLHFYNLILIFIISFLSYNTGTVPVPFTVSRNILYFFQNTRILGGENLNYNFFLGSGTVQRSQFVNFHLNTKRQRQYRFQIQMRKNLLNLKGQRFLTAGQAGQLFLLFHNLVGLQNILLDIYILSHKDTTSATSLNFNHLRSTQQSCQ